MGYKCTNCGKTFDHGHEFCPSCKKMTLAPVLTNHAVEEEGIVTTIVGVVLLIGGLLGGLWLLVFVVKWMWRHS
jgi:uncharacterized OB-fold protein